MEGLQDFFIQQKALVLTKYVLKVLREIAKWTKIDATWNWSYHRVKKFLIQLLLSQTNLKLVFRL